MTTDDGTEEPTPTPEPTASGDTEPLAGSDTEPSAGNEPDSPVTGSTEPTASNDAEPTADEEAADRPVPTAVPPRGGKKKPTRPPARPAKQTAKKAQGPRAGSTAGTAVPEGGPAGTRAGSTGPGRAASTARPGGNRTNQNLAARRRAAVAAQRRKRQWWFAGGAIALVVIVVVVLVLVKVGGGSSTKSTSSKQPGSHTAGTPSASTPVPASVLTGFAAVKPSTLAAAAANGTPASLGGLQSSYPQQTSDPAVSASGKPEALFVGGEFCPYCATERWAILLAFSQFGTFHGLGYIHSSPDDGSGFNNIPTVTFYGSTYTSSYVNLVTVETANVAGDQLQTLTPAQAKIVKKYDTSGIPFLDFDGKAILQGVEYSPTYITDAGSDGPSVAQSIIGGASKTAQAVYWNAGVLTSEICRMTDGQPGAVCKYFPKPITS